MKKYIFLLLVSVLVYSCTDHFEDLNTDKKNPSVIPAEPLFTNGVRNAFDLMSESNVNRNVFRLYAQYWAQTTYPDESQYNMVGRQIPDRMWDIFYRDVLKDLQEARTILGNTETTNPSAETIKQNKVAVINIMEAYVYTVMVDIFGDIPYSQALNNDFVTPVYDDAQTVYYDNIDKLVAAINALDDKEPAFDATQDVIYQGDIAKWIKFGHSLHLKLAMRIADSDNAKAKGMAEMSADKVFTSNDDNFDITYHAATPNTHPLWVDLVQSGRNDFVGANTIIDIMNDLNDPRIGIYFEEIGGAYLGGIYGDANAASSFSGLGEALKAPDLAGTLMSYAEVEFLLAEARERNFDVGGTAESHYDAGVTASIMFWGGTAQMATDYLAQSEVAYTSAAGDWKQKVGIQKWLSLFNNGFEGWTTWRLLDFTGFNAPPGMSMGDIPVRFIFPINEATLNTSNYDAVAAKYGGDVASFKLFWDMN